VAVSLVPLGTHQASSSFLYAFPVTMDNPPPNAADAEAGIPPGRPVRNPIPQFLFISFMLFLLTNHNGDEFLAKHQYQNALQTLTYQVRFDGLLFSNLDALLAV
jgi:hypothetical protein